MAKTDIRISCGCNMQFTNVSEAEAHADSTMHTLTVTGSVKPGGRSYTQLPSTLPEEGVLGSAGQRLRRV